MKLNFDTPTQSGSFDERVYPDPPSVLVIWLRRDFPWMFQPRRAALVGLVLLLLLVGAQQVVARLKHIPQAPVPVEVQRLRVLLSLVEECRGTESLLVLLPSSIERDKAVDKLLQQQARVTAWLQSNGDWMVAEHGRASVDSLTDATFAWWAVQQRVTAAQPEGWSGGLTSEARMLTSGPSADAYGAVVASVERMVRLQMR